MKMTKGFTMVEMLGVLVILIITFIIMYPCLTRMIKDTNDVITSYSIHYTKLYE